MNVINFLPPTDSRYTFHDSRPGLSYFFLLTKISITDSRTRRQTDLDGRTNLQMDVRKRIDKGANGWDGETVENEDKAQIEEAMER